jgi:hypothetical protein
MDRPLVHSKRSIFLSITHIFGGHQEPEFDVGETGHSSPHDDIARRTIAGAVQIAAEACELGEAHAV